MAKSLEDTSFYVYNRLISLNEVGGDPRRFGTTVAAFHHANQQRLKHWPKSMITLSTHDSKRSGDVRARINVLSEVAGEWRQRLARWTRLNRGKKGRCDGRPAPSRNAEYLLYQTLLGTWPLGSPGDQALASFCDRIETYMLKAVREAKIHTSWINPNEEYERAVIGFVRALLNRKKSRAFLEDFQRFQKRIARFGLYNSLSQTLLHLTVPGVPDIYQGTELWRFFLVDPDNRRTVDFAQPLEYLAALRRSVEGGGRQALLRELLAHIEDGRAKLFVVWQVLAARKARPELFSRGDYLPLKVSGDRAEYVCAFMRRTAEDALVVVASRWHARLVGDEETPPLGETVWGDTQVHLPEEHGSVAFADVFTAAQVRAAPTEGCLKVAHLLNCFPVALLTCAANLAE